MNLESGNCLARSNARNQNSEKDLNVHEDASGKIGRRYKYSNSRIFPSCSGSIGNGFDSESWRWISTYNTDYNGRLSGPAIWVDWNFRGHPLFTIAGGPIDTLAHNRTAMRSTRVASRLVLPVTLGLTISTKRSRGSLGTQGRGKFMKLQLAIVSSQTVESQCE